MANEFSKDVLLSKLSNLAYKSEAEINTILASDPTYKAMGLTVAMESKKEDEVSTGFKAFAFKDSAGKYYIAYRGTDGFNDTSNNTAILRGTWSAQMSKSTEFTKMIMDIPEIKGDKSKILTSGHSAGGTLAQINAKLFGLDGATFDAGNGAASIVKTADFAQKQLEYGLSSNNIAATFSNYNVQGSVISSGGDKGLGNNITIPGLETSTKEKILLVGGIFTQGITSLLSIGSDQISNKHSMNQIENYIDMVSASGLAETIKNPSYRLEQVKEIRDYGNGLPLQEVVVENKFRIVDNNSNTTLYTLETSGTDTNSRELKVIDMDGKYQYSVISNGNGIDLKVDKNNSVTMNLANDVTTDDIGEFEYNLWQDSYSNYASNTSHYESIASKISSYLMQNTKTTVIYDPKLEGNKKAAFYFYQSNADNNTTVSDKLFTILDTNNKSLNSQQLKLLDTNKDNKLSNDEITTLKAWKDTNENGIADSGEIVSLNTTAMQILDEIDYDLYSSGNGVFLTPNQVTMKSSSVSLGSTTSGVDTLIGSNFVDTISSYGDNVLAGGGNDIIYIRSGDNIIYAGDGDDEIRNDRLYSGNSKIYGGSGNDDIKGGKGNDYIDGGTGADFMSGYSGDDIYVVNSINDDIWEDKNNGNDTVVSSVSYILNKNVETIRLIEGYNIHATGNGSNNTLIGNSANNILDGLNGKDTMIGRRGDDVYYVDSTKDFNYYQICDTRCDTSFVR